MLPLADTSAQAPLLTEHVPSRAKHSKWLYDGRPNLMLLAPNAWEKGTTLRNSSVKPHARAASSTRKDLSIQRSTCHSANSEQPAHRALRYCARAASVQAAAEDVAARAHLRPLKHFDVSLVEHGELAGRDL